IIHLLFFFFHAEDGIRVFHVTGVQTCALPIFPVVFRFLIGSAPDGVVPMTDIGEYLDFVITMFIAFGAAFEVPVAIILLTYTGRSEERRVGKEDGLRCITVYLILLHYSDIETN